MLAAVLSVAAFALLAAWARYLSPAEWELAVLVTLALGADAPAAAIRAINTLGDVPVWGALVAAAAALVYVVRGLVAAVLVGLSMAADLVAAIVKLLVERDRPPGALVEHFLGVDSFAFPSGHVVRAVALAAVLAWLFTPARWRLRAALGAAIMSGLLMGFARVALGVHWPTDALGGLLLGAGWFAVTVLAISTDRRSPDRPL